MGNFEKGAWNFVFVGCEGAPETNCGANGGTPSTNIPETPIIAEKPYITIEDDGTYTLHRPQYKSNVQGHDFTDRGDLIDFSHVYTANADTDTAQSIQAKLDAGLHVVFQPGIYELDQALQVSTDG